MTFILTSAMLRENGACRNQVRLFESEWPNGLEVHESAIPRIVELGFNIDWFANMFLTAPAWAELSRVTAPAWAELSRVTAPAWAEYERVTAPAWAEYERVRVSAWAEYERVTAQARAEYERVRVSTCMSLYIKQREEEQ